DAAAAARKMERDAAGLLEAAGVDLDLAHTVERHEAGALRQGTGEPVETQADQGDRLRVPRREHRPAAGMDEGGEAERADEPCAVWQRHVGDTIAARGNEERRAPPGRLRERSRELG